MNRWSRAHRRASFDVESGARRWRTPIPAGAGFIGGVDIGPDGNLYVCANGGFAGGHLTSLTREGDIRWSHEGFANSGGSPGSRMGFIDDLVIKVEDNTPFPVGAFQFPGVPERLRGRRPAGGLHR